AEGGTVCVDRGKRKTRSLAGRRDEPLRWPETMTQPRPPRLHDNAERDSDAKQKRKVAEIYQVLNNEPVDIAPLRRMAISEGGLLLDEIRCKVWPRLLNVNIDDLLPAPEEELRENSKDYQQVLLDVRRSLRRFPPDMPDEQREGLQEELIDCILQVLQRNTQLHYYQGYHDIVVTFLLVGFYGPNHGKHQTHFKLPDAHHRPSEPRSPRFHAEVN
ncbi:TBC1 domain family member 20, partial [Ophiophagus hannah]